MINSDTKKSYILTADIGGSHITTAFYSLSTQSVLENTLRRIEFSSKANAEQILTAWCNAFKASTDAAGIFPAGISLAIPGPFDYDAGVCWIKGLNKYETLYGMDIRAQIAERLSIPVENFRFRNDAEATIAGEATLRTGQKILGVTLGTGFGSAISNGQTTTDINLGSEAYQNSIADDYLSTRWFLKAYYEQTGISITGVKELVALAGTHLTAKNIFGTFADNFCGFMLAHIDHYQPELLLLCGNIAKASPYFIRTLRKRLPVPVEIAVLGESAALIGAAGLFTDIKFAHQINETVAVKNDSHS